MKYDDFLKGVELLESYCLPVPHYVVTPSTVSVKTDCPLDKDAVCTLLELGWTQDEPRAGAYNPDKEWTAHDVGQFIVDGK